MPHTRKFGKRVLPIQGLEAFTNRAYRFRKIHNIADWHPRNNVRKNQKKEKEKGTEPEKRDAYRNLGFISPRLSPTDMGEDDSETLPPINESEDAAVDDSEAGPTNSANIWDHFHEWSTEELLEATEAPTSDKASGEMVALFATPSDEFLALLQDPVHLNSPQAVMYEWVEGDGLATDVHLVMRPRGGPRWVNPDTGKTHQNVAVLSQQEIDRLTEQAHADPLITWFV